MTTRIREFLKHRTENGPCLVLDLDVVRENYQNFAKALPDTKVFYAVKANPAPEILKLPGVATLVDAGLPLRASALYTASVALCGFIVWLPPAWSGAAAGFP